MNPAADQAIQQSIAAAYHDMINSALNPFNDEEKAHIYRAFQVANEAHRGVRRRSGEPYVMHSIAVARIAVAEIGLGYKSAMTALLHDVVEDTDYTTGDLKALFGEQIAQLVDGLTKLGAIFDKKLSVQTENFKKMLLAMSSDIRVILIKLADRLHNMRTLGVMPPQKQEKITSETTYLYIPMAHRLGLFNIKTEMEDLVFKFRFPAEYADLEAKVNKSKEESFAYVDNFKAPIVSRLQEQGLEFEITGRIKSLYSIWNKMQKKHISFEEVYDLFALRIVFKCPDGANEKEWCWKIYSIITDIYTPNRERTRDWVSVPKVNGYEALHITAMGPQGHWVELQIRSERMDSVAEYGYASHWRYKNDEDTITDIFKQDTALDKMLQDIHNALTSGDVNPTEFLDQLKLNLFANEITVFTPKGKMITLPKDATALDFAYVIHTQIGSRAIGAKINHRLTPVSEPLHNGDQVEILTADNQKPKPEWLRFAITPNAANHIKDFLKKEEKERLQKGRAAVDEAIRAAGGLPNAMLYKRISTAYAANNKEELFSNIGAGLKDTDKIEKVVKKHLGRSKFLRYWELQLVPRTGRRKTQYGKKPAPNGAPPLVLNYETAPCCNPISGDEVIGFEMGSGRVVIHKKMCPNAIREASQHGNQIVNVRWTEQKKKLFLAAICIFSIDRSRLMMDLLGVISVDFGGNIKKLAATDHDGMVRTDIEFYIHNLDELHSIMAALAKISGVKSVNRVEVG